MDLTVKINLLSNYSLPLLGICAFIIIYINVLFLGNWREKMKDEKIWHKHKLLLS